MGRRAKSTRAEQRLKQKRAQRAANTALYEGRKAAGKNKKSKRAQRNAKGKGIGRGREVVLLPVGVRGIIILLPRSVHRGGKCGNAGCRKCSLGAALTA